MPSRSPLTTTQQGYGYTHVKRRRHWAPQVEAGRVACWRCGERIDPGTPWDLGHDDDDRTVYHGPEHRSCNRSAGGIKGNLSPLRYRRRALTADRW